MKIVILLVVIGLVIIDSYRELQACNQGITVLGHIPLIETLVFITSLTINYGLGCDKRLEQDERSKQDERG